MCYDTVVDVTLGVLLLSGRESLQPLLYRNTQQMRRAVLGFPTRFAIVNDVHAVRIAGNWYLRQPNVADEPLTAVGEEVHEGVES